MKKVEFFQVINRFCRNSSTIVKAMLYGSQAKKDSHEELDSKVDLDLILIIRGEDDFYLFKELAKLSKEIGILIHPLVINEKELEFKSTIQEYKLALEQSTTIYQ